MFEVRALSKQFGPICALDDVSIAFEPGMVHGIVGENGAGKSTLMNLLSGIHAPSSGEILIGGRAARFNNPGDAIAQGIVMIHQELNLVDDLDVADNVFLGRELRRGLALDRRAMVEETARLLKEVAAPFSPTTRVRDLSIAGKQLVEIAKAISYDARLLIMDEPTAVLSERETTALFALVRRLKESGVTVLFVSHLLTEVVHICDRITVLRDGRLVETLLSNEANPAKLAGLMVGRDLDEVYPPKLPMPAGEPVISIRGLTVSDWVESFDLDLRAGEIVGLAGLVGSGRTEAAEATVGLRPKRSGVIHVNGEEVRIRNLRDAKRAGLAYISEDRKGAGLVLSMSTRENLTLANLRAYANPVVRQEAEKEAAESWVQKLGIRVGDIDAPVSSLSGGNQQKVAVGKWLDTKPAVLILDEPTRGIDVGAKGEMYRLIHELAKDGMACLMISSEMPELIGLCQRIVVLREGRIAGELTGEITEEAIMLLAAGVAA